MTAYGQHAVAAATGMDTVVALYDAAIRSLHRARQAVGERDVVGRRVAVKKVVDVLMYLQARLRPEVSGHAAAALSDFYAAMFTMTLEASHLESAEGFEEVILCVRNVRDAWAIAARDPAAGRALPRDEKFVPPLVAAESAVRAARWSA